MVSLAFVGPRSSWAFLGIIPIVTGLIDYWPPYALLGIDTTSPAHSKEGRPGNATAGAGSSAAR